jgi:hypothetical protein
MVLLAFSKVPERKGVPSGEIKKNETSERR